MTADDDIWSKTGEILSRLSIRGQDRTFSDFLRSNFSAPEWTEAVAWATLFVEGFNAADHKCVSANWLAKDQKASDDIGGDRQFSVVNGYGRLVNWLMERLRALSVEVLFERPVQTIEWRSGHVAIDTATSSAEAAVITIPLGVLQAQPDDRGTMTFRPDVPNHRAAATRLAMGSVVRITFRFRTAFWQESLPAAGGEAITDLSFLHARDERFPTWWTAYPLNAPLFTGWVGGPAATEVAQCPCDEQQALAVRSLASATGLSESAVKDQIVSTHHHDWQRDPFARGAYSYVPVNGLEAINAVGAV